MYINSQETFARRSSFNYLAHF